MKNKIQASAIQTINTELAGAKGLAARVDINFIDACQAILNCTGKVVVSGIGKSGHIGRKIAATLSSTGTPSFYVHPSEALHGDLGMVGAGDVALLISYSGFAAEFRIIFPLLKEMKVSIIAFTGNPESPLANAADYVINIHTDKEACPLGLAPTSSAINTLIMGDALAISLMEYRNFSETDYARTHPAGSLGTRLLCRVRDIMRTGDKIPFVSDSAHVTDALFELTRTGMGLVTIINAENKMCGVFTDGDLRRLLLHGGEGLSLPLSFVMTTPAQTLSGDELASEALTMFHENKISAAPVVDSSGFVTGAINIHDIHDAGILLSS